MLYNTKSNAARIPCGKCGGYMGGKLLLLPGEVLQTGSRKSESRSNNELQEVSRGHSTLVFFQGKGRTIVSLKYRPEGGQCVERRIPRKRTLMSWDKWMRRRFRMYIWKQWKKPKTKVANLIKLGVPADKAYQWGNSRQGYWRIAGSPVLQRSITNERLAAAGYFSILSYYESLHLCG